MIVVVHGAGVPCAAEILTTILPAAGTRHAETQRALPSDIYCFKQAGYTCKEGSDRAPPSLFNSSCA